jgi:hypothetical protein
MNNPIKKKMKKTMKLFLKKKSTLSNEIEKENKSIKKKNRVCS